VGYYGDSTASQHGFLYNIHTGAYTFVDDPAEAFDNGVEVTQITGISDSGEIAGFYMDANGVAHSFTASSNLDLAIAHLRQACQSPRAPAVYFSDLVIRFHETERPVRTASVNQLRQPIYRSSSGRWRAHAAQLKSLLAALEIEES
jgi:hypothetical protein